MATNVNIIWQNFGGMLKSSMTSMKSLLAGKEVTRLMAVMSELAEMKRRYRAANRRFKQLPVSVNIR